MRSIRSCGANLLKLLIRRSSITAVAAVVHLARQPPDVWTSGPMIAEAVSRPPEVVGKILGTLKRGTVSVLDILEAVGDPLVVSDPPTASRRRGHPQAKFDQVWTDILASTRERLRQIAVADLVAGVEAGEARGRATTLVEHTNAGLIPAMIERAQRSSIAHARSSRDPVSRSGKPDG
jgi:DNA-binding IscR family transcriptional regulator